LKTTTPSSKPHATHGADSPQNPNRSHPSECETGPTSVSPHDLWYKLLVGAPTRDQSVELLGVKLPSPVIIGPTGLAGLLWPRAELAAARAAARFGTIYSTSHASTATIEEIGAATPGPKWMQVFLYKDRALTAEFAARAAAAGYKGLILTVDNQVMAGRDRDAHNGMTFPLRWGPRSVIDFMSHPGSALRMRETPSPTFVNYGKRASIGAFGPLMNEQFDPDVSWSDVDRLRGQWRGPLLIKGLLHADDAREAINRGADAIIVSNHGGRQSTARSPRSARFSAWSARSAARRRCSSTAASGAESTSSRRWRLARERS
jgi:isopentenyl diphosphate isomerase/L-lactate dehydrogenase-like FMN-dependent dehydrogenase